MAQPLPDDPLEALRRRIQATQDAVERLAAEAAGARESAPTGPPPSGEDATRELHALVGLMDTLRGLLPPHLQDQLTDLVRQLLMLVRAILDWWIDRLGERPGAVDPIEVQDIEVR